MTQSASLFNADVWEPALEKFGAVTHLTVTLYDAGERIVARPLPTTPLYTLFEEHNSTPEVLTECARQCLAQRESRPAVTVSTSDGLAAVGTSLVLEGKIVGAAVAGYALVDFAQSFGVTRLARQTGIPYSRLWELARRQQPVPEHRLKLHGELLQVLGDTILRENHRTHQYEEIARRLDEEMSAKDQFLAVLSHELRTPLTPILGWVAVLRKVGDSPAHRQKAADSIERNALLEVKLVDDLLDLNRIVRNKITLDCTAHAVQNILHEALDTIAEAAAAKMIDIQIEEPRELLVVEADSGRLQQVFGNILSNAVKFTPGKGTIQVTVHRVKDNAVVRFLDSGEGISPEFLPRVFEIFRQQEDGSTRRSHSGLGIGLAVVKRLVELHGGTVDITSNGVGQGTCVTVQLPLTFREIEPEVSRPEHESEAVPLQDLKILVVEDSDDSRDATRRVLEVFGATVVEARDGMEGLDALFRSQPDLVFCDLEMPRMNGFEFLEAMRRSAASVRIPVVALSSYVTSADHRKTAAAGFAAHLNKPFTDTDLIATVRSTLSRVAE